MTHEGSSTGNVGERIRRWRKARGFSQMALALEAGISPRHMSFVETGRSRPGRGVVQSLASVLELPLREENDLMLAAGYAPRHPESRLDAPELERVREILEFLLERHEPNTALVFDGAWDIVMANRAHRAVVDSLMGRGGSAPPPEVTGNLLRLTFHPRGLRPIIQNWTTVAPVLMARVEDELRASPSNRRLAAVVEEVRGYGPVPPAGAMSHAELPILPVHLRTQDLDVRLISVVSTLGTARDVMLDELRLETFFPADDESEQALLRLT